MQTAIDAFEESIRRAHDLHALHLSLTQRLTSVVDLSDMLRAEIVLAVSAFDFFIHELTRLGMLECHGAVRRRTEAFNRFQVPMETALGLSNQVLDAEIRTKHSYLSFQQPDKVADAVRLFSGVELWNAVATELGVSAKSIKADLSLVIDRRNKIAHEADIDPSYPGQRWPIDRAQVEYACTLLENIARAIFKVTA
jgi:hypothetical protein